MITILENTFRLGQRYVSINDSYRSGDFLTRIYAPTSASLERINKLLDRDFTYITSDGSTYYYMTERNDKPYNRKRSNLKLPNYEELPF